MRRTIAALLVPALFVAGCGGGRSVTATGSTERDPAPTAPTTAPTTTTSGAEARDGACGVEDPYYPDAGGDGMDVLSYHLTLELDPARDRLDGTAEIEVAVDGPHRSLCLDLVGLEVETARVGDEAATVRREGERDIRIITRSTMTGTVTLELDYGGSPGPTSTATAAVDESGWFDVGDEAAALSQPIGAATWFPANDHPADKARFSFDITVPDGLRALANGLPDGPLDGEPTGDGRRRFRWSARAPMSPYLATVVVGRLEVEERSGPDGLPIIDAYPASMRDPVRMGFSRVPEMITFFEERFGRYPFDSYGGIVLGGLPGFALETQTRPVYSAGFFRDPELAEAVTAHELAHQWFGNAVGPARWDDIWLNEGLTTYAEWLWTAHSSGTPLDGLARRAYGAGPGMNLPPADPGPEELFGNAVYQRGGLTMYALSRRIGEDGVARVLRRWVEEHEGGVASTEDFLQLVTEEAGPEATATIRPWLFDDSLPPFPS